MLFVARSQAGGKREGVLSTLGTFFGGTGTIMIGLGTYLATSDAK